MDHGVLDRLLTVYRDYPGTEEERAVVCQEIRRKSFLVTEFFGSSGDVKDPYPDYGDDASLRGYEECARFLSSLMSTRFSTCLSFLSQAEPDPAMKRTVTFGTRRLFG